MHAGIKCLDDKDLRRRRQQPADIADAADAAHDAGREGEHAAGREGEKVAGRAEAGPGAQWQGDRSSHLASYP